MKPKILICLVVSVFSLMANAQVTRSSSKRSVSRYSDFDQSFGSEDGFYFSLGTKFLFGKNGTINETVLESRSLSVFGAESVLGYELSNVIFGLGIDYNAWLQQTKATDVNNTNLSGSQLNVSGVLGYRWSPIILIGKYFFKSDYSMSKADVNGQKSKYSTPESSYSLQLLYSWTSSSNIGIEYTNTNFKKIVFGGSDSTLSEDSKLNASAVGVVYVYIF